MRSRPDTSGFPHGIDRRFEDRDYLDAVHDMPCSITGFLATENEGVDPAHIGTAGRGVKTHDFYAPPLRHSLHAEEHRGFITFWLGKLADKYLLKDVLRAWALVIYLRWKTGAETDLQLVKWILDRK